MISTVLWQISKKTTNKINKSGNHTPVFAGMIDCLVLFLVSFPFLSLPITPDKANIGHLILFGYPIIIPIEFEERNVRMSNILLLEDDISLIDGLHYSLKLSGKRAIFLFTAWLKTFVST